MAEDPEFIAQARREGRISSDVGVNLDFFQTAGKVPSCTIPAFASEDEFQRAVIASANVGGWRCAHFRKVRVQRKNGKTYWETPVAADGKGFLDLELVRERLVKLELKMPGNKMTKEQVEWGEAYTRAGIEWYCFWPDDWPKIVKLLRQPPCRVSTAIGT